MPTATLMMISLAAAACGFGLLLGVIAGTRVSAHAPRHRGMEAAAPPTPTPDVTDLSVQSSPAIGRARVYYTSHPDVDVLEAVLAGLRRL